VLTKKTHVSMLNCAFNNMTNSTFYLYYFYRINFSVSPTNSFYGFNQSEIEK